MFPRPAGSRGIGAPTKGDAPMEMGHTTVSCEAVSVYMPRPRTEYKSMMLNAAVN
jgi:hypothetical protein